MDRLIANMIVNDSERSLKLSSTIINYHNRLKGSLITVRLLNAGPPRDNENQSDGRTEAIDSNILKPSQSNVRFKTMKSQVVCRDALEYGVFY